MTARHVATTYRAMYCHKRWDRPHVPDHYRSLAEQRLFPPRQGRNTPPPSSGTATTTHTPNAAHPTSGGTTPEATVIVQQPDAKPINCGLGRCDHVAVGLVLTRTIDNVFDQTDLGTGVLPLCEDHFRAPLADVDLIPLTHE